jgi:hypothetical protein
VIQIFRSSIALTRPIVDQQSVSNLLDEKRRCVEAERCSRCMLFDECLITSQTTKRGHRHNQMALLSNWSGRPGCEDHPRRGLDVNKMTEVVFAGLIRYRKLTSGATTSTR